MNEVNELYQSAQYWLDAGNQHLVCDAWAVDETDYEKWAGHKLIYVSAMGPPPALQQAARALRTQSAPAHITSSDRDKWRTSLDTAALSQSRLFRVHLPETAMHHMTLMPADQWYEQNYALQEPANQRPLYLFPDNDAALPESLGNHLRRLTTLLCPPQWDNALLSSCRQLGMISRLEAHGVSAWKLTPDIEAIQAHISHAVQQGNLRL